MLVVLALLSIGWVIIPRKVSRSFALVGVWMFLIASSLSFDGWIPSCVMVRPKKPTLFCLNWSFVELRPTLFFFFASSMLTNTWSCSCCVESLMIMSSAIPVTLGMSLYTSSSLRWKMSCDTLIPKGRRWTLYLPNGVLRAKSRLDSSSSSTCQYPLLVSATEKYFFPSIWGSISSMVLV